MKEATGEASMTGITIAVIAIIAAIAIPLITNMVKNIGHKSCCTSIGGEWDVGIDRCVVRDAKGNSTTYDNTTLEKECGMD